MTSQSKLTVRPLPHLDFVLGYPGIPASSQASRNAAHISGNIEVRLGSKGMKARWIRVELRKLENAAGGEHWGELIGRGPIDVWTARAGAGRGDRGADDEDGSHWEVLQTADFPFRIAIPEGLPSSCKLDKQCGISYEVVASLCVKTPKGLFRKEETTSVIQSMHPVTIEKHELHSTWPVYNQPEIHSGENGLLRAKLRRERSCFAPGDRVKVKVIVSSNRVEPAKLKSVAFTLKETVTFHGGKSGRMNVTSNSTTSKAASQHVEIITQKAKQVGKKMYKGDSMDFDLECLIPKSHPLMTVATAKHIEVSYTMRVYVDISKAPIVIDHVPMVMTTFPRAQSIEMMRKIGFVDGLSERDMMLDDDDDDSPMVRKPTIIPGPQPTRGYSGSSGSQYGQGMVNGVQRRDTVMTNFSGPGMAGRGIPGQIFNYGSYGAVQAYPDEMAEPPRPAFAGPPSLYEGAEGNLSATERAALSHYHTATPQDAAALGVDYSTIATVAGLETPPGIPRAHFESIPEEARPAVQQHLQQHHAAAAGHLTEAALSRQQQQDAEEEKERLYQRARQQAERNQRRADERRAQALQNGGSLPPSANSSRANTPSVVHGRNAPPIRPASAAALTTAEEEKRRLYERARREAETYQRGYAHGATFPEEQAENISSSSSSNALTRPANQSRHSTGAPMANAAGSRQSGQQRRDSELYWLDSPAVDPLEARGIHALGTQKRISSSPQRAIPASSSSSSQAPLATPIPPGGFPSAEEEKKRLYDQAKAQTETHLQSQQAANSSVPSSASRQSMQSPQIVAPSASSEKAQIARFQAAIDEVQRRQGQTTPQPQQGRIPASVSASSAAPLTSQRMSVPSPAPTPAPVLSEKEQMRLYYAAKDRQAEAENSTAPPASASSSSTVRPMNGQPSQVVSPKATHAATYQNGMPSTMPPQNHTSPLPQGAFPSQNRNGNGIGERNRVVSYTPSSTATSQPPPTHTASPSLPSFNALTLGNDINAWRGGTPNPNEGPWAPTISSSNWLDANTNAGKAATSSAAKANGPPPPIPPKTPLLPLWK